LVRAEKGAQFMALIVADLSIELVEKLRALIPRIKTRDKSLADQIQRAASSVVLNIGEAEYSDPGNRRARFHTAAGSAGETRAALRLAVAWGIVPRGEGEPAMVLLDHILPILWKLTRG
jgi:four helix bundle protein